MLLDMFCSGRSTVPMLWDTVRKEVVNNESADIIGKIRVVQSQSVDVCRLKAV